MTVGQLKSCPFCGAKCDVVTGLGFFTFFHCVNDECMAIISFKFAEEIKTAINRFNKRNVK